MMTPDEVEGCGEEELYPQGTYTKPDTVPSYDKGGHKERSRFHQPNHEKHWRKVERESKIEREP